MTERREIKQRSPAVWAKVREAYLAGEPAASVARRFDVGYGNLRHRAYAEGWTRKAVMARDEAEEADEMRRIEGRVDEDPVDDLPFVDPETARQSAINRAGALLAAGRGAEATTLLRAAETLGRMTEADAAGPAPVLILTPEEDSELEARGRRDWEGLMATIHKRASELALQMLCDQNHTPMLHNGFALRWRAEVLGPVVEAADRAYAEAGGWARRYWGEDGRMLSKAEVEDDLWRSHGGYVREALGMSFHPPQT